MAKARKINSGSWNIRIFLGRDKNGKKKYKSITADTKKECEYLANKYIVENKIKQESEVYGMFITDVVAEYIKVKKQSLSPNTIRGYITLLNNQVQLLNHVRVSAFNASEHQRWIDRIASDVSPKTVKNADGLVVASLRHYNIALSPVKLPQKEFKEVHIPTTSEVKDIIEYFKLLNDIDMVIAVELAATGTLRRGEVVALDAEDVNRNNNTIFVHKSIATDEKGNFIEKEPKTYNSNRIIELPKSVIDLLPTTGKVVNLNLRQVSRRFAKCINKLGYDDYTFHSLRHYSASIMHAEGIPSEYIMKRGGWKNESTLNRIYRNSLDDYEKSFTKQINDYFEDKLK